jgi:hypothetical protein
MKGTTFSVTLGDRFDAADDHREDDRREDDPGDPARIVANDIGDLRMGLIGLEHVAATKRAEDTEDREHDRQELAAGKPQLLAKPLEM